MITVPLVTSFKGYAKDIEVTRLLNKSLSQKVADEMLRKQITAELPSRQVHTNLHACGLAWVSLESRTE